jgi:hypothetical protein
MSHLGGSQRPTGGDSDSVIFTLTAKHRCFVLRLAIGTVVSDSRRASPWSMHQVSFDAASESMVLRMLRTGSDTAAAVALVRAETEYEKLRGQSESPMYLTAQTVKHWRW